MLQFNVSDVNGSSTISALDGEKAVGKVSLPTEAFNVLSEISAPTPNKVVQQLIAAACDWPLNNAGRCPKAAALLERITSGYGVFNGVISIMVATSQGKSRYFHFNESLAVGEKATMLTRQAPTLVVPLEESSTQEAETSGTQEVPF